MKAGRSLYVAVILIEIVVIAGLVGQGLVDVRTQPLTGQTVPQNNSSVGEAGPDNPTAFTQPVSGQIPYLLEPGIAEFTDGYHKEIPGYWVRTNDRGLRDEAFNTTPPNGTIRILVLGDSFAFGWGVNRSNTITERLERRLNKDSNETYQVINAGIPGWGMQEFYLFLWERGLTYNPDIVVVTFFWPDIVSVNDSQSFQRQAQEIVPDTAENREKRVKEKQVELLEQYYQENEGNHVPLLRYIEQMNRITDRNKTDILYFYIRNSGNLNETTRQRYRNATGNRILFTPEPFRTHDPMVYTLPGDMHYNDRGHKWLADALYRELRPT